MTQRLPLFPLGVVLFPGALLPLHIFEPRYRRLLADCIEGDPRFGLVPTGVLHEAPPPGTVGCIAELRGAQQLPDGRANIVVQGSSRFMVQRYLDESTPYLVAAVEPFTDRDDSGPPAAQLEQLIERFHRYSPLIRELRELDPDSTPLPSDDVEALSFRVAETLDCEAAERQRLLEMRSTAERVERMLELLPALTAQVEEGLSTKRRAASNGKGHLRPGLLEDL